ncbi:aminodeoxychorismate synthase component I [Reinekea marina]|uniref:Aminodeoxychorismate synthase component I n=1 Tax=Reinekea marina TaxID=1310421 RepID=A0ABV7WUH6_9GAMM|nr:aminodeoxychorismate synthase component I [Reinekea marina]MDN3649695.1 aminodeoxychorismate synthase component I [Reinekea marina]
MQVITLDYLSDVIVLTQTLSSENGFIWFHNGPESKAGEEWFSAWPTETYQYLGQNSCQVSCFSGETEHLVRDYFELLKSKLGEPANTPSKGLFTGGLAGHLNYEIGLETQGVATKHACSTEDKTLATVGLYHWACKVDHNNQTIEVFIRSECPTGIKEKIEQWASSNTEQKDNQTKQNNSNLHWQCSMSYEHYCRAFKKVKDYIYAGDIYQANLTRQWSSTSNVTPWANYCKLLRSMSAPFSFYQAVDDVAVMSVSPERFLQVKGDTIFTQPIKGTRARGITPQADERLKIELQNSVKDQAENLMIVDLLRNDIAKNAEPGSVVVDKLFELQSFKNVHHLVSSIRARKLPTSHPLDILKDAFPGGSITGAPKKRAMEIIDELEVVQRRQYCGTAFFLSFEGYLDSNIMIRTLTQRGNELTCSGGGGLVYDSDLDSEYQESELKIQRLLDALSENTL